MLASLFFLVMFRLVPMPRPCIRIEESMALIGAANDQTPVYPIEPRGKFCVGLQTMAAERGLLTAAVPAIFGRVELSAAAGAAPMQCGAGRQSCGRAGPYAGRGRLLGGRAGQAERPASVVARHRLDLAKWDEARSCLVPLLSVQVHNCLLHILIHTQKTFPLLCLDSIPSTTVHSVLFYSQQSPPSSTIHPRTGLPP